MSDVRLIDANVLPNYKCQVTATIGDRKGPAEMRFVFWQDIEKAPTIDAVPVVHARWVHEQRYGDSGGWVWRCSACRREAISPIISALKYCHSCGARMDGGDNV